jgi:hypothetical protein
MFLLAASPTLGTSSAVPGALAYPSDGGQMSQVCAGLARVSCIIW